MYNARKQSLYTIMHGPNTSKLLDGKESPITKIVLAHKKMKP